MKKLNFQFLFLLFAINLPSFIFAQTKVPIDIIVGVSNSFEVAVNNSNSKNFASTTGLFTQFQIGEYFSMETSVSYASRHYKREGYGFCATGTPQRHIELSSIGNAKIRAVEFDHLLKLHVVNTKRASFFLGLGGLVRLPLAMKVQPLISPAGRLEVEVENEILSRVWGVKFAGGMDFDFKEKFQLSTQVGWNNTNGSSLFTGEYSYNYFTNMDNGFLKVSLGYQL